MRQIQFSSLKRVSSRGPAGSSDFQAGRGKPIDLWKTCVFSNKMKIQAGVKRVWIQAGVKRPKKMFFELSRPKNMIFELNRPKHMFFEPQVAYPRRIFMFLLFVGCRGQDPGPLDLFPVKITPPPPRRIYMTFVGGSVYEGGN